jgi:hypothetical protein
MMATQGKYEWKPEKACDSVTGNFTAKSLPLIHSTIFQLSAYYWLMTFGSENSSKKPPLPDDRTWAQYIDDNALQPLARQTFTRNEYDVIWIWYFGILIFHSAHILGLLAFGAPHHHVAFRDSDSIPRAGALPAGLADKLGRFDQKSRSCAIAQGFADFTTRDW